MVVDLRATMLKYVANLFRSESKEFRNDLDQADHSGSSVPEVNDDQPRNPYTEIKLLSGHSDRIHLASAIDDRRVFTSAHDNTVAIWDPVTGNLLFKLYGHTKPVNCVHVLDYDCTADHSIIIPSEESEDFSKILLTASFDKSIRLWSLDYGNCLKIIMTHNYAVKCFTKLKDSTLDSFYCSAGDHISIWDENMTLLSTYKRKSLNSIQMLLSIKDNKIVAATDKHCLSVYYIDKTESSPEIHMCRNLPAHREPITCLVNISDAMFASASLDGTIMVWTTYRLEPTRQFNFHEQYKNTAKHSFIYSVKHIFTLEQRYIFAAIANGFYVFDTTSERCIVKQVNAHHEEISHMALIGDGTILATCSVDGTTRLWSYPTPTSAYEVTERKNATTPLERIIGKRLKQDQKKDLSLELIGECAAHSDSVQFVISCGREGFLTCAMSDVIILWKDGNSQLKKEDELLKNIVNETRIFAEFKDIL